MNAVAPAATAAQSAQAAHVFVTGWRPGPAAAAMTAVIDPGFLAEMGWDPAALVMFPRPGTRWLPAWSAGLTAA